jgi:hypothetical protein
MPDDRDLYQAFHGAKLWALLPELYHAQDSDSFDRNGPLRELVNRIGAQAAILRRSLDRLWDDQSIETCDDWIIPYIGDLLATNLVPVLPAREQRLDVAKTIYYRRRKGTLAVLEEITANITGWDVKLVEFFRRLGRTRHLLDPPIGLPVTAGDPIDQLRQAEGLIGPRTLSGAGGFADLRDAYGASRSRTAFDEFSHTADFRAGRGVVGWHDIPHLGVFLWRLISFGGPRTTPVFMPDNPDCFTFDPTGRDIPLFARIARAANGLAQNWVSPDEWQLPGPISQPLYDSDTKTNLGHRIPPFDLYPASLAVYDATDTLMPAHNLDVLAPIGRARVNASLPLSVATVVSYFGFASEIGAGPYDRRVLGAAPPATPAPITTLPIGVPISVPPPVGTIRINDSLTRDTVPDAIDFSTLTIQAGIRQRPLIRLGAPLPSPPSPPAPSPVEWVLQGASSADLVLDGLFVSGGDIVLRGDFNSVTVNCCTLDPGSIGTAPELYAFSIDHRPLVPGRIWIEATIATLSVTRSITGPIRTREKGTVETLRISDSILQAIPTHAGGLLTGDAVADPSRLVARLQDADDPVAAFVASSLSPATAALLAASSPVPLAQVMPPLLADLNTLIVGAPIYDADRFAHEHLRPATSARLTQLPATTPVLNRMLLEDAFPIELADAALAIADGAVALQRCTVLGTTHVHRFDASECIVDDFVAVDDLQQGCVRFSAVAHGSAVPRPYESVTIPDGAPLFTSRDFGQPGYAQLLPEADAAILPGGIGAAPTVPSILRGAENGSEMGAFSADGNPLKERGLLLKFQEFMPTGLVPVLVYVT